MSKINLNVDAISQATQKMKSNVTTLDAGKQESNITSTTISSSTQVQKYLGELSYIMAKMQTTLTQMVDKVEQGKVAVVKLDQKIGESVEKQ